MWHSIGVLYAVLHHNATGEGQRVDTSLLAGLVGMFNLQGQRNLSVGEIPQPGAIIARQSAPTAYSKPRTARSTSPRPPRPCSSACASWRAHRR